MIILSKDKIKYFSTRSESLLAAKVAMRAIKLNRPWTKWKRTKKYEWEGTDGLVAWKIRTQNEGFLFSTLVTMSGDDCMYYNYSVPCDGSAQEVVSTLLHCRQIDVDQGELWRFLDLMPRQ